MGWYSVGMQTTRHFICLMLAGAGAGFFTGCESASIRFPSSTSAARPDDPARIYIGTYTRKDSKGIYAFELDRGNGGLSPLGLMAEAANPSFLAMNPDGRTLYAANETGSSRGEKTGAVSAFEIDTDTGALALTGQQPSGGAGPCHLTLDHTGRHLLVANYGGGSVASLPVDESGRLAPASSVIRHTGSSVNPQRQKAPHAHSINVSPDNRHAIAADLGIDQLLTYALDREKGTLTARTSTRLAPGAGPRHFAFHPSGRFAYVINELHCTITVFAYEAESGDLSERQTLSTLDVPLQKGFSTAEVQVHPSGRFLYGSNRGHDSIAVFSIHPESGTLRRVQVISSGGVTPRNFGVDPVGGFLIAANQNSDNLVVYRIDASTGRLTPTGHTAECPTPVCVRFAP